MNLDQLEKLSYEPYLKTIKYNKANFSAITIEKVTLLVEILDDEPLDKNFLNKIDFMSKKFERTFFISSKKNFEKLPKIHNFELLDNSKNIMVNLEKALLTPYFKNILYINSKIKIDEKSINGFEANIPKSNCIHIPKLVTKNNKIVAAGNMLANKKLVIDYGVGADKNLSSFNFEKKLNACSNKAIYFSRNVLKAAYHYDDKKFDNMKLHDLFNFLLKYDNLEVVYSPTLELISSENNQPFYNSITTFGTKNNLLSTIDKRKKILIFADEQKQFYLKNYLNYLINENYFVTLVTDKYKLKDEKIENKIEIIDNLKDDELRKLITKRKNMYSNVWVLNNDTFNLIKDSFNNTRLIYTPNIRKIKIHEYIIENEILYSNIKFEELNKDILVADKGDIYPIEKLTKIKNTTILCNNLETTLYLNNNNLSCEILNDLNLNQALSEISLEFQNASSKESVEDLKNSTKMVDVVLTISNCHKATINCINKIFSNDINFNLYLINDGFKSKDVRKLLVDTRKREGEKLNNKVVLIENKRSLGEENCINFCLAICKNKILYLNSDNLPINDSISTNIDIQTFERPVLSKPKTNRLDHPNSPLNHSSLGKPVDATINESYKSDLSKN